jgi:hypothetical protein
MNLVEFSHHSYWKVIVDDIVRNGVAWRWTIIHLFWHLYVPSVHKNSTGSLNFLQHRREQKIFNLVCFNEPGLQINVNILMSSIVWSYN